MGKNRMNPRKEQSIALAMGQQRNHNPTVNVFSKGHGRDGIRKVRKQREAPIGGVYFSPRTYSVWPDCYNTIW